jgi:hypothetical protein
MGGGAGGIGQSSIIPIIETGKSRRMAGRPSTNKVDDASSISPMNKNPSNKNYGLFL